MATAPAPGTLEPGSKTVGALPIQNFPHWLTLKAIGRVRKRTRDMKGEGRGDWASPIACQHWGRDAFTDVTDFACPAVQGQLPFRGNANP